MPNINRLQSIWTGLAYNNRWSDLISEEDVTTFLRRSESEGPEFYCRALYALRKDFLTSLGDGKFASNARFGRKRNSVLPRFLYGAFSRVFADTGELYHVVDVDAVACLNQLTAVFGKIRGGHTPQSEKDVIQSFCKTEEELSSTPLDLDRAVRKWTDAGGGHYHVSTVRLAHVLTEASRLVRRVLAGSDPREISPKHGSGASACRTPIRDRYAVPRYISKIDNIWPMSEYYFTGSSHLCDKLEEYMSTPDYDPCARVLLVPKDARGPRLISCEPKETMWIQQGVMSRMYADIEAHSLTRGKVNFTFQGWNQIAAYVGSCKINTAGSTPPDSLESGRLGTLVPRCPMSSPKASAWGEARIAVRQAETLRFMTDKGLSPNRFSGEEGSLSSLDLKDASDCVRLDVVEALFPENWVEALKAARSEQTELPDGTIVPLSKHAPMGSATCFPVMALTIWSVLTAIAPKCARKHILVYGDDIIVPSYIAPACIEVLVAVGLKVNVSKSFTHGPFRESCGEEFFRGCRVTPVYLRQNPMDDVESLMSLMAFTNNLLASPTVTDNGWMIDYLYAWFGQENVPTSYLQASRRADWIGFAESAQVAWRTAHSTLTGVVYTDDHNRTSLPSGRGTRLHPRFHTREFKIRVPTPCLEKYETNDWCHVLRSLVKPSLAGLGSDPIHNRVRYVRRWCSIQEG